jgi:HSP20 family protein
MPLTDWETDFDFMWPVSRLQREVNRLFDEVFQGFESSERQGFMFSPVVEVDRQDDQYEITVELPGVRPENVNVEVQEDMLTISGSKERKETRGEGEHRRSERMYGSFRRSFRLPEDVRQEDIRATFRDGVLTLSLPRDTSRQQQQVRRIEVQRGDEAGMPGEQPAAVERQGEQPAATH